MKNAITRCVLGALAVGGMAFAALPGQNLVVGKVAPPFKAVTMDGKKVEFPSGYKGRLVLLNFWATWCHPCVEEQPLLAQARERFKRNQLEILGVTLDEGGQRAKIEALMDQKDMTWPQIYQGLRMDGSIPKAYGIVGIPQNYLVDGDTGEILRADIAPTELSSVLEAALAKKFGGKR